MAEPYHSSGYSEKVKEALTFVDERVDATTDTKTRSPMESYWDTCAAYYEGTLNFASQITSGNADFAALFMPSDDASGLEENRLQSFVQRAVATVLSGKPQVVGIPEGDEIRHRLAAKVARDGWKEYSKRRKIPKRVWRKAVLCAAITGTGITKSVWDPRQGVTGGCNTGAFTPWETWFDPYADSIDDATWACTLKLYGLDHAMRMFPDIPEKEMRSRAHPIGEVWQRRHRLFSANSRFYAGGLSAKDNTRTELGVMVTDFWCRPIAKKFENGLRIQTIGESGNRRCVNPDELDNPHVGYADEGYMELPFTILKWTDTIDSMWGMPLIGTLMSLQEELNRNTRDLARIRQRFAHPRPIVDSNGPYASGLPTNMDECIRHNYEVEGEPPRYMEQPPVDAQIMQLQRENMLEAMGTLAGQSEASQAKNPDGVRTGVALEQLIERDQSLIAFARGELLDMQRDNARMWLILTQKKQSADVTIRRVGVNTGVHLSTFNSVNLEGCHGIEFVMDDSVGISRSEKSRWVREQIEFGLLNPADPEHREIIGRTLESGTTDEALMDFNISRDKAERHLEQMIHPDNKAFVPKIEPTDDHQAMFRVFSRFKDKPEYELLEAEKQSAIRLYMQILSLAMMEAQDVMAAQQQMAEAAPGGGGGSPPKEPGVASQPKEPMSHEDLQSAQQAGGMIG